jgi:hypothetical protein
MRRVLPFVAMLCGACHGVTYPTTPTPTQTPSAPVAAVFLSAGQSSFPIGGGTATVTIYTASHTTGAAAAPGTAVALSASSGSLSSASVITDGTGHAAVEWAGTVSTEITATTGPLSGHITITVATPPAPIPNPTPPGPAPTPGPNPSPTFPGTLSVGIDPVPTNLSPAVGDTLTFRARITSVGSPTASIAWDFTGDGIADRHGETVLWTFTAPGRNAATVVVTDAAGHRAESSLPLIIDARNQIARAELTVDQAGSPTSFQFRFTGTAFDHDGNPVTPYAWEWDFGDGMEPAVNTPTTIHVFSSRGTKLVRVRVTTPDGRSASAEATITVS